MSAGTWIAVAALGGLGSVGRVLGTVSLGRGLPVRGTLVVNLAGAFALGVLSGAGVSGDAQLLAGTALLGALTTFSTWMHETVGLWALGRRRDAAGLVALAVIAGLAAATVGRLAGSAL